jgi:hypothetical protein
LQLLSRWARSLGRTTPGSLDILCPLSTVVHRENTTASTTVRASSAGESQRSETRSIRHTRNCLRPSFFERLRLGYFEPGGQRWLEWTRHSDCQSIPENGIQDTHFCIMAQPRLAYPRKAEEKPSSECRWLHASPLKRGIYSPQRWRQQCWGGGWQAACLL